MRVLLILLLLVPLLASSDVAYQLPAIYYTNAPTPEQATSSDPVMPSLNAAEAVKQNADRPAGDTDEASGVLEVVLLVWAVFVGLAWLLWFVTRPYKEPRR